MPNKATVRGVLMDATLAPIAGGKIIATLQGSDIFDGGLRVVTQKVGATTDAQGAWSLELIVNGEGESAGTTWTIEGYNQYVAKVFEAKSLFLVSALDTTLGDLERTSAQNLRSAREGGAARLIVAAGYDRYLALPEGQRRANDLVVVNGREEPPATYGSVDKCLFDGVGQIYHGDEPAILMDASGAVLIGGLPSDEAPAIARQPAILPENAGLGDSITLDLGRAEGVPTPVAEWTLTLDDDPIRDRVDPEALSMELSEPGEYALAVNWSNASGTVVANPALLTVAAASVPTVDYTQAAGYIHAGSAYSGADTDVAGVNNDGNGGWNLTVAGTGNAIAMTSTGIRFNDGRFLQASALAPSDIDGAFIVLRMMMDRYGSGVAQLFAANPSGGKLAIHDNKGTLQARYDDGVSRSISLGNVTYGQEFVVGLEIDNALQRVRAYTLSGSIITETPLGTPWLNYVTVRAGQFVHGTLSRAALFTKPVGGSFAASFEQVIEDFVRV
ncbi:MULTISPECIES: hypothetical protein [Paracoccus]|uniref:hypothetical protein n=1 Tax=Paracoccus TaxID=265 RepID=UPI001F05A301|nr:MULTISPECIES: hypothetical protein [Paracoccus]